jgi:hypothetical protein
VMSVAQRGAVPEIKNHDIHAIVGKRRRLLGIIHVSLACAIFAHAFALRSIHCATKNESTQNV